MARRHVVYTGAHSAQHHCKNSRRMECHASSIPTSAFFSTTGIATAGLPLMLEGQPFVLFARLSHTLADGEGLRAALEWKGAAGLKCCVRHWNVLMLNSDLAHRDRTFVEIDCSEPARFKATESNELFDQVDTLLAM